MQLDEHTVPKRNTQERAEENGGEELLFQSAKEGISGALSRFCGGKTLFVADGNGFALFADHISSPRAISFVFDGDALPLFSMPDGVSCVLASGNAETLRAARYFSLVRNVPCVLFPVCAALDGAVGGTGEVRLGTDVATRSLATGEKVCDLELMAGSFHHAYARLLLAKLAAFESRVLCAFHLESEGAQDCVCPDDLPSVVRASAALPERSLRGEGFTLARALREEGADFPEWTAYVQLTALYAAFFERGKPRRYFTPDYARRAKEVRREVKNVPTAEEYAMRALRLERVRAMFLRETRVLAAEREKEAERLFALCGERVEAERGTRALKYLPELHGVGLSMIMRDFGLLEWDA